MHDGLLYLRGAVSLRGQWGGRGWGQPTSRQLTRLHRDPAGNRGSPVLVGTPGAGSRRASRTDLADPVVPGLLPALILGRRRPGASLVFLAQPVLWRNVCPLATLNQWSGKRGGGRSLGRGAVGSGVLTLGTFALLLPARPLLFDESAIATAALLGGAAIAALAAGVFVRDRGGFCHLLCPVLPAERLYGVAPTIPTYAARCDACSVCTPRGCPELAGDKAFNQILGPARKSKAWIRSPWGVGFLAFPGLVIGFFTLPSTLEGALLPTYGWIWGLAAASWIILALLTLALGIGARRAVAIAGGMAAMAYYWAVVPSSLAALGVTAGLTGPVRLVALAVVFLWLARALIRDAPQGDAFDHAPWAAGR